MDSSLGSRSNHLTPTGIVGRPIGLTPLVQMADVLFAPTAVPRAAAPTPSATAVMIAALSSDLYYGNTRSRTGLGLVKIHSPR
jgi:hypothetical protein